ncbi:MAG: UDP-glucose/GDP-mannose dehydrogenase family protein, partial [bacterium]|nr:UDP-glucose/GDP-mannose dehydrogenase family protein [bacterium]
MKITIIGTGYVGLVSGACFAELGHDVLCVDKNEKKIDMLLSGTVPFFEPGLSELVRCNHAEGRLSFSTEIKKGVEHGSVIFVAVDTPSKATGAADLSSIENVALQIGSCLSDDYRVIVEKSTVPVQTGEWLAETIRRTAGPNSSFDVVSNPEFLREGTAIRDFMNPDRVVIGAGSERASALLVKLYEPINAPLLITDINSAELIKHSANAFLAMKISFINSIADICDLSGADIDKVARGIGLDRRISMDFLNAGIGYGGSCFPKDVSAFI